jgi:hypothetical protein
MISILEKQTANAHLCSHCGNYLDLPNFKDPRFALGFVYKMKGSKTI